MKSTRLLGLAKAFKGERAKYWELSQEVRSQL